MSDSVKEYISKRLKELGVKPLSKKERSLLENRTINTIPQEKVVHVHDRTGRGETGGCGMKTAIWLARTPQGGLAGGDDVYYCLLCEEEYQ